MASGEILANWDDFTGGHWGNMGPSKAPENTFGGVNMVLAPDGSLMPVASSRWLQLNTNLPGRVWGMIYAWGADGRVYFVQSSGTSTITSVVYRFTPDPDSLPNAVATTSVLTWVSTVAPDWVEVGTTIYVTMYGIFTYVITTSTNSMIFLTGSYGNAPAGRCIARYGERLFIGGTYDLRFASTPNRIYFSGDDTGNNPADRTAWESLNFFDIGNDGDLVVALYNLRDYLVAVLDDQTMYLISGTPPSPPDGSLTARRVYGFNKGAGGLSAFQPAHGAVDPSQTRLWMFDHSQRAPQRFNGANMSRVTQFGAPLEDREADNIVQGALTMMGGPDEFVCHGVAVGRGAGEGTIDHRLELVRLKGVYTLMHNDVIAARQ
jgi:hypothetical protein